MRNVLRALASSRGAVNLAYYLYSSDIPNKDPKIPAPQTRQTRFQGKILLSFVCVCVCARVHVPLESKPLKKRNSIVITVGISQ